MTPKQIHESVAALARCRAQRDALAKELERLLYILTDLPAGRNYQPAIQQARAALATLTALTAPAGQE